ncbi:MAG: hypothetical protein J5544_05520 [Clostridia bacterium]|nr:hypothetical protein [Clostridia bacterium]
MKRAILFLLALLFCFSAVSCGKQPEPVDSHSAAPEQTNHEIDASDTGFDPAGTITPSATQRPSDPGPTYREVYDPETDFDNRFGRGNPGMAESEDAYYYISSHGNYVYYFDKFSEDRDVLCGKPECLHDKIEVNQECNGYVRSGAANIGYYCGKLYYIGYSTAGDSIVKHSLYRMNPDGTERKRLFPFTCESQYFPGSFLLHRGKLYGWGNHEIVESAVPKFNLNISCWDLETGEQTLIYDRTDVVNYVQFSVFCFGKYIYMCDSLFYPDDPGKGTTVIIMRWDTETERLQTLYRGEGYSGEHYQIWVEAENRIYFASMANPANYMISPVYCLCGGEVETAFTVDGHYSIFLIDGAVVFLYLPYNLEEHHAIITDYEGNVLYEGSWSIDALRELSLDPAAAKAGFGAVYGDRETIYVNYRFFAYRNGGINECIIRYHIRGGEIADSKVLCAARW